MRAQRKASSSFSILHFHICICRIANSSSSTSCREFSVFHRICCAISLWHSLCFLIKNAFCLSRRRCRRQASPDPNLISIYAISFLFSTVNTFNTRSLPLCTVMHRSLSAFVSTDFLRFFFSTHKNMCVISDVGKTKISQRVFCIWICARLCYCIFASCIFYTICVCAGFGFRCVGLSCKHVFGFPSTKKKKTNPEHSVIPPSVRERPRANV